MSSKELEKVIARVAVDEEFQVALAANPAEALDEYDLSQDEVVALAEGLSSQKFDALGADLGERTSRAGLPLGDIIDALGDMVDMDHDAVMPADSGGEIEALPTPPPAPEGAEPGGEIEATPITLPRTADEVPDSETPPVADGSFGGDDEISATPITLPRTADGVDSMAPNAEGGGLVEEEGILPTPPPEPAADAPPGLDDSAFKVETFPPEPADSMEEVEVIPTPPPEPAEVVDQKLDRPEVLMTDAIESDVETGTEALADSAEDEGLMPIPPPQPADSIDEAAIVPNPPPDPSVEDAGAGTPELTGAVESVGNEGDPIPPGDLAVDEGAGDAVSIDHDSIEEVGTVPLPPPEPADSIEESGSVPTPPPQPADSIEEIGTVPAPPPQPAAQDVGDDASIIANSAQIESDGPEIELDVDDAP